MGVPPRKTARRRVLCAEKRTEPRRKGRVSAHSGDARSRAIPAIRRMHVSPAAAGKLAKGAALARFKGLLRNPKRQTRLREGRADRVAFSVPEKPLSACYPGLADGQRFRRAEPQQSRRKGNPPMTELHDIPTIDHSLDLARLSTLRDAGL